MNFNSLFCAFGRVLAKRERIQVRSESAVGRAFLALLLDADTSHALFRSELCSGRFARRESQWSVEDLLRARSREVRAKGSANTRRNACWLIEPVGL